MSVIIQFSGSPQDWPRFGGPLRAALKMQGVECDLVTEAAPEEVDYIVYAPGGPITDFTAFTKTKAVLSLWAGVEKIVTNPTLTQPLARMVDPGLSEGMTEWVVGHVLRHHLGIDAQLAMQDGTWSPKAPPLARHRTVGILGLGELGRAAAQALQALNFNVVGWSRRQKSLDGVACLSGDDGLAEALAQSEILVLLLPQTAETENVLNAETLTLLPPGAVILNPGRGPLIDDDALLSALDSGNLAHATLDVFRTEPLPPKHPFWAHPKVTVTPHIASETRPETAAMAIAENIRRAEAGEPLLHLVDRAVGY